MNFQNVNPLNNQANVLSGNLLPMSSDNSQFPISWRIYCAIVLLVEVAHTTALIHGLILVPKEKALKDGTVAVVVTVQVIIMMACLYAHKKVMMRVIQKMNDILRGADETMQNIIKSVLKPVMTPFKLYGVASVISVVVWTIQPVMLVFERNTFYYVDYNLPAAFTAEPFSTSVLIWSTIILTIGSITRFLKKYSLDIYMVHLVLLLTAQYRYIATKLTMLFRDPQNYRGKLERGCRSGTDKWVEKELRTLCHHQKTVVRMSLMVKKLLSINFTLLYLNSVFQFCFIGLMMTTVPSLSFLEGMSVMLFAISSLTHFFLLCFTVQTLSDASTEMTDEAFHEDWYQFRPSIQRTFLLLIMSNNLECRISAIEKFNLSLPSFIAIIHQSYSIALLFLKMN